MAKKLTQVAFDIETTGFTIDDHITVVGLALSCGCRVFLNTHGRATDSHRLERSIADRTDEAISVSTHGTEPETLRSMGEYFAERLAPKDYLIVAFNGERWDGGFDLPFLRTRLARLDLEWPLDGLPYADLFPILSNRFNTERTGNEVRDLAGTYDALVPDDDGSLDPFADSADAVRAFERGAFEPLIRHNVADLRRTRALGRVAERYCGKSEFRMKSLTATCRDPAFDH